MLRWRDKQLLEWTVEWLCLSAYSPFLYDPVSEHRSFMVDSVFGADMWRQERRPPGRCRKSSSFVGLA
jgi:hypothetical protein